MAFKKLATIHTRDYVVSQVEARAGMLDRQKSQMNDVELDAICHEAVLKVFDRIVIQNPDALSFYRTDEEATEIANLIDISTQTIYRIVGLYDSVNGKILILESDDEFFDKKLRFADKAVVIARYSNILATDNKLQLQTFRGTGATTVGTLTFVYLRVPRKTTFDDSTGFLPYLDVQDNLIPVVIDVAVEMLLNRKGMPVPKYILDNNARALAERKAA